MPRLHTIQSPTAKAQRRAKTSRPAKASASEPLTKRQITAADAPKIALALGLVVALLGAGWFSSNKANIQREQERMTKQMQYESGAISAGIDPNLAPAEADEAQQELQDNDPNFKA